MISCIAMRDASNSLSACRRVQIGVEDAVGPGKLQLEAGALSDLRSRRSQMLGKVDLRHPVETVMLMRVAEQRSRGSRPDGFGIRSRGAAGEKDGR